MSNKTLYVIDLKDGFTPKIKNADKEFSKFDKNVKGSTKKGGGGGLGSMLGAISPLTLGWAAVGAGIAAATGKVVSLGKEMEQTRVAFSVMFGSSEEGNKMLDLLNEFANVTPYTNDQVIKAGKTLKTFQFQTEAIAPTLKILGDVAAGTGSSISELSTIFGRIQQNGRIQGEELNQLIDRGFNPLSIIAEKTGKSMVQLRKDMSNSLISFDMVQDAFVTATSEGGQFFNMMDLQSKTFGGLVSTIQGKLGNMFSVAGEGLTGALKPLLEGFVRFIDLLPKLNLSGIASSFRVLWDAATDLLSPIMNLFDGFSSGITFAEGFQIAINSIAAAVRGITTPFRLLARFLSNFTEAMKPVVESFQGLGDVIAGVFSGDVYQIARGVEGFKSGFSRIRSGIEGIINEEANAYADIFNTQLKTEAAKVDLAGAMDLSKLQQVNGGGTANGAAGSKASTVSGNVAGVSSGGIKNVTLNIDKLIEQITFETVNGQSMQQIKDMVTRVLVEASSDASRLVGG